MKITVDVNNVKIDELNVFHKGEYNVNNLQFSFSSDYTDDLVSRAVFGINGELIDTAIINNQCIIPEKVLLHNGDVFLGVYAYNIQDGKLSLRYSPQPTKFYIFEGSYDNDISEPEEITPSQFEQYMQALNDGLNKVEESIKEMDSATSSANDLVDDINQKLENGDFIGPEGPQGIHGNDGVGITTITSGQPTIEEDKTVTPVTVNKTDGSSQIFNVEAKNGIDGQNGQDGKDGVNGQDGLTPSIGENGNWFLGDTDTGKPSRGEVGPTPDLTDYVKNTDYATGEKGGVVKVNSNSATVNENGYLEAQTITQDQYDKAYDSEFISKGTLENIKNDYVGSSTPVQNLNNSLRDLTPKQDAKGTDNVFDDGLKSPLYDLGGDGKSEQVVTTGKNLFNKDDSIVKGYHYDINTGELETYLSDWYQETYIEVEPNTTYSLYCGTNNNWIRHIEYNESKEFIIGSISNTFTTNENTKYVRVSSGRDRLDLLQLEKSSSPTEYEPYTGRQPSPNPDYPQEINSIEGSLVFADRGKNLFNKDGTDFNGIVGVNNFNGKIILANSLVGNQGYNLQINNARCQIYCQIEIDKDYYLSFNDKFQITTIKSINEDNIITNTLPNNNLINSSEQVIAVTFAKKDSTDFTDNDVIELRDSLQIEQGTQATSYEPYLQPNEVTFNLNDEKLRSVGDVKDELVVDLDTGDYYKLKNIEHLELAISNMDNASEDYPGWLNVPNIQDYFPNVNAMINTLLEFKSNITTDGLSIGINTVSQSNLWLEKGEFNLTQTQWKEQYPDLVFKLDYSIPSTETIKLGTLSAEDLAKLKTFKGYNNVTVNTNLGLMNIRFTYGLDIKKYVDNKLAEISTQIIKEG